jgi:hypothetical protein
VVVYERSTIPMYGMYLVQDMYSYTTKNYGKNGAYGFKSPGIETGRDGVRNGYGPLSLVKGSVQRKLR